MNSVKLQLKNTITQLNQGNVILYPTDTVWGIGCDATNFEAISKIYQLKNRTESKSLIVLVNSIEMLKKHVFVPQKALEILKITKNPTTIIYQNPVGFASNTIANDDTIAIRIVNDEFCGKLIELFEKPIVSTSANVSGNPTPKSFSEIEDSILNGVDYIVNLHQNKENTKSSTILKINGNDVEVLRP